MTNDAIIEEGTNPTSNSTPVLNLSDMNDTGSLWQWVQEIDPLSGEYNVFVTGSNRLTIDDGNQNTAIVGMRVIMRNIFAPMPIAGHTWASAQYIGRGGSDISIRMASIGDQFASAIQSMYEETSLNARDFRRISGSSRVSFEINPLLQLLGLENGVISGCDVEPIPGSSDGYNIQLNFMAEGQHQEGVSQELYRSTDELNRILFRLMDFVQTRTVSSDNFNALIMQDLSRQRSAQIANDAYRHSHNGDAIQAFGVTDSGNAGLGLTPRVLRNVEPSPEPVATEPTGEALDRLFNVNPAARLQQDLVEQSSTPELIGMLISGEVTSNEVMEGVTSGRLSSAAQVLAGADLSNTTSVFDAARNIVQAASNRIEYEINDLRWQSEFDRQTSSMTPEQIIEWERTHERPRVQGVQDPFFFPFCRPHREFAIYQAREITQPRETFVSSYVLRIVRILNEAKGNIPTRGFFVGSMRGVYYRERPEAPLADGISRAMRTAALQGSTIEEMRSIENTFTEWPPLLSNEGSPVNQVLYGTKHTVSDMTRLRDTLTRLTASLTEVASDLWDHAIEYRDFTTVFPGLSPYAQSADRAMNVHECYPDLGLPVHPSTGRSIDTEPDFYIYNTGEEGGLNQIGPEIQREVDERLANMAGSFSSITSGEMWRSSYQGPSRTAPGTLSADESVSDGARPFFDTGPDNALSVSPGTTPMGPIAGGGDDSYVARTLMMSPTVVGTNNAEAENTRTRRQEMYMNTVYRGVSESTDPLSIGPLDRAVQSSDYRHAVDRAHLSGILSQSMAQCPDNTLTFRRAFPAFKLYFLEDDTGPSRNNLFPRGRNTMFFDDFYNYNSVMELRLIRSRKVPSDLLVLRLTNVTGLLERRRWVTNPEQDLEIYAPGFEETELENPLNKIMIKEGLKVQVRFGYTNNPIAMNVKFIGEVVEFSYTNESSDEMTIICQSYGNELILESKGAREECRPTFIDTADMAHTIMCSPELVHFGRFERNPQFNPAEARTVVSSTGDRPHTIDVPIIGEVADTQSMVNSHRHTLALRRTKWLLANNPADDNIYAPSEADWLSAGNIVTGEESFFSERSLNRVGQALMGNAAVNRQAGSAVREGLSFVCLGSTLGRMIDWNLNVNSGIQDAIGSRLASSRYRPSGQTIWDLFKEMELRHPGWISHPRPYGTRMTMFFGLPCQRYWADEISDLEVRQLNAIEHRLETTLIQGSPQAQREEEARAELARTTRNTLTTGNILAAVAAPIMVGSGLVDTMGGALSNWIARRTVVERMRSAGLGSAGATIGRTHGRLRSFRRYHLITSNHHILGNNIRTSELGTFNAVNLKYGDGQFYSLKADDSIPSERTKVEDFFYADCENETMARRYCIGLLMRHLKDVYKGELLVTGMDVDPYDICYLYDNRAGMYGAFEIEQVVDTFTPETGWVTEITPDLIVRTNDYSLTSTEDAMRATMSHLYARYAEPYLQQRVTAIQSGAAVTGTSLMAVAATGTAAAATAATIPIALAAGAYMTYLGGYHIFRYTQDRQPIWISPLLLGERPWFTGLDGYRQDGIVPSLRGRILREFDAVEEGWRTFAMQSYANDVTSMIATGLAGQGG